MNLFSNTLTQVVGKLPTNCLSVFDHFVGLALKGLGLFLDPKLSFEEHSMHHCVKSVQIWSYFWSVFSCIQSEDRKIRDRNNSDTFHAVHLK